MLKKILIVEDFQSTVLFLENLLSDLPLPYIQSSYYCDDALKKVQQAIDAHQEFDVMITDLSFVEDGLSQILKTGQDLIKAVRKIQPHLKIMVFSSEKKDGVITTLFDELKINAFVHKGRNDIAELKIALEKIELTEKYISPEIRTSFQKMNAYEFSNYDTTVISLLSKGFLQKDIPEILQEKKIKPNSLSSIEKRLNLIKSSLELSNNEQLVSFCKDLGII